MKIEILQEMLIKGLSLVSRAVASRPQLAVLGNILIEAKREGVILSATDLEIGIKVKISAKVVEEGMVTAPARTLSEFVGSINPGKIEISLERDSLKVVSGAYKAKFQTIAEAEFPRLPEFGKREEKITLNRKDFAETAHTVIFAAARDSLRPVLTGILVEINKASLSLVATDGFRLAIGKVVKTGEIAEKNLLVPMRAIAEVARIEEGEELEILSNGKTSQVIFQTEEVMVTTQTIEGNFPDYQKIIPKETTIGATMEKEELLQAIKATNIFARENSNMMRWEIGEKEMTIKAEMPERGESVVKVPITRDGEAGQVVFNTKFLLEFLGVVRGEIIKFEMKESLTPGTFKVEGNNNLLYVVMPINS